MLKVITKNEQETEALGAKLASALEGGEIFLLQGNLGAGKTVLARGIARELGVKNNVTSPTFVLMKVYKTASKQVRRLVHVDAYRVEASDLLDIGLEDYLAEASSVVLIEWGEKAQQFLDEKKYKYTIINIDIDGATRTISWK